MAPRVALGLRSPASQGGLSRDRIPTVAQERLAMSSEATLIPGLQKQLPPGWWAMQGGVMQLQGNLGTMLYFGGASPVVHLVKNLPAMQET